MTAMTVSYRNDRAMHPLAVIRTHARPASERLPRAQGIRAEGVQRAKGNVDIARAQKNGDPSPGPREVTKRERSG